MAALELIIQKHIEERRHFIVNFDISRLWQTKEHLHKLRCHITDDDLAILPVIVLQSAILERQLDPLSFLVPTVDLESLGTFSAAVI